MEVESLRTKLKLLKQKINEIIIEFNKLNKKKKRSEFEFFDGEYKVRETINRLYDEAVSISSDINSLEKMIKENVNEDKILKMRRKIELSLNNYHIDISNLNSALMLYRTI
jgi:protein subunit release factor A